MFYLSVFIKLNKTKTIKRGKREGIVHHRRYEAIVPHLDQATNYFQEEKRGEKPREKKQIATEETSGESIVGQLLLVMDQKIF